MRRIIAGCVNGKFRTVFEKISKLHAKNEFSLAIILGDLFADPAGTSPEDEENVKALHKGEILVPLPTYFTLGRHCLPAQITDKLGVSEDEVCPNLYFLDKRSTTKTSEGIRIVNLGGALDLAVTAVGLSKERFLPFHTLNDARSLHGSNTADILITSHWPTSIRSGSHVRIPENTTPDPQAEQCVADLCSVLKPRYHFTTSDEIFYEREPFYHPSDQSEQDTAYITRFISLAAFSNSSQQKWLYAFTIDPTGGSPTTIPADTTASPFASSKKRTLPDQEQSYSRFSKQAHNHQFRSNKRARPPPTPQECFFCLSNPNLATHLITSIATDSYLTAAKGPLTTPTSFPSLKCPAHILIIPLAHSSTLTAIPDPESRTSTLAEMHRYRGALQNYLSNRYSVGQEEEKEEALGSVTWELSRRSGVHLHWQFLPVPAALVAKGLVEAAFKVEAENEGYPPFHPSSSFSEEGDHFRIWIWRPSSTKLEGEGEENVLTLPIATESRFDAQFGRRVMAKLLRLEKRMDWRDCTEGSEEERRDAEVFKEGFKRWDFSLETED